MEIIINTMIDVPGGFYCDGCGAYRYDDKSKCSYCHINGETLTKAKSGRFIKNDVCLMRIASHLREHG